MEEPFVPTPNDEPHGLGRGPIHRTRQTTFTQQEMLRRGLQNDLETAEFDAEGYLHRQVDRELHSLDCGCTFTNNMAGQCFFCMPPARLCVRHFLNCHRCGRGICRLHTAIVVDIRGQQRVYCPRHRRAVRIKRLLRVLLMTTLAPFFIIDRKDHRDGPAQTR